MWIEVVGETVRDLVVEHVQGRMSEVLVGEEGSPINQLKSKWKRLVWTFST